MYILSIKTDAPEAEIGIYEDDRKIADVQWAAHRQLAATIHCQIKELLQTNNLDYRSIQGIVVFRGPGSFTGLRIGISVANALADGWKVPVVGTMEEDWVSAGINRLNSGENDEVVLPAYGGSPHITKPKR